jgi:hypothetical protein
MSASDELAAIEARLTADENEYAGAVADQNVRDRRILLSLVREQQSRLKKMETVAADFAERGERIEEQFGRDGNVSAHTIRAAGLGDGYREAARSIRAALHPAKSAASSDAQTTEITRLATEHQPPAETPDLPPEALAG